MGIETMRLILREMRMDDFDALHAIFADPETMQHYPAPFDADKTRSWILRNQARYAELDFGLWAVVLKETGEVIGDCGLTMQSIHGQILPEIGYHIHKDHQRKGYASEAARACRDYAFEELKMDTVYSYMKYTNRASSSVAIKNGMSLIEEYDDPVNVRTCVYKITRADWENLKSHEQKFSVDKQALV